MKTRAGLFRAVGEPLEVVELDLAEPGPNDVVVRMAAVGICGTDLHQVKGEWQRPTPMVLGHEGAGVVEHVGRRRRVGARRATRSCSRGRRPAVTAPTARAAGPAACVPLHRAIGNGTLVDGTTGMSLGGETVYRGTATGAWAERVVVSSQVALPTRRRGAAARCGAARLCGADGRRRSAVRRARRAGRRRARDRRRRRRPVRRPGRPDRRRRGDRRRRPGRVAPRAGAPARRDARASIPTTSRRRCRRSRRREPTTPSTPSASRRRARPRCASRAAGARP